MESETNHQIRISAKNLGQLALPDYCPRCFWLKLKLQFKLPYQVFPGIFSSIDSYSKKITWNYFEKYGKLPSWFNQFGQFKRPIKSPGLNQFNYIDEKTNIKLTGVTDDIFMTVDNKYFIIDYKTAKFTKNQDKLLPIYQVQLNGYAMIAESIGISPVVGLGLVYYEPRTEVSVDSLDDVLTNTGFNMEFEAHLKTVKLDPAGTVLPLLAEVRKLYDMSSPPSGAKCGECGKLSKMSLSIV